MNPAIVHLIADQFWSMKGDAVRITPADLCALALRYFDRHPCALSSATPRAMSDDDEFHSYVTILLICSPSRIPRLPISGPLPYTYSRHVICVSDGVEFLWDESYCRFSLRTSYFYYLLGFPEYNLVSPQISVHCVRLLSDIDLVHQEKWILPLWS